MRGMDRLGTRAFVAAAFFWSSSTALAGTTDAFTFYPSPSSGVVVPVSGDVTYSLPEVAVGKGKTPAMTTYAAFEVGDQSAGGLLLKNTSGNTLNNVVIIISFKLTDTAEVLDISQANASYLPQQCSHNGPVAGELRVTCTVRQMKADDTFPSFKVFLTAPEKKCGSAADPTCGSVPDDIIGNDKITTGLTVVYAEGTNGPDQVQQNSNNTIWQDGFVTLGTNNPTRIKSAVPKDGANVYTGKGGVPEAPTGLNDDGVQFTELLNVPALPGAFTVAEVRISNVKKEDPSLEGTACLNGGRFKACPTYETIVKADDLETRFTDPSKPLEFIYRVDASNLLMPPAKLLNSIQILYSGKQTNPDGTPLLVDGVQQVWADKKVEACINGQPNTNGLPCLVEAKCLKKSETNGIDGLIGDCQLKLWNNGNGFLKLQ